MSIWTHVNASFRIDSMGSISDETITKVFGKELLYEDLDWEKKYDRKKYLPLGSEGSLHLSIYRNPDESSLASTVVTVFGDLRNYDDYDAIEEWFNRCCRQLCLRQAICQVNVEGLKERVFRYYFEED